MFIVFNRSVDLIHNFPFEQGDSFHHENEWTFDQFQILGNKLIHYYLVLRKGASKIPFAYIPFTYYSQGD